MELLCSTLKAFALQHNRGIDPYLFCFVFVYYVIYLHLVLRWMWKIYTMCLASGSLLETVQTGTKTSWDSFYSTWQNYPCPFHNFVTIFETPWKVFQLHKNVCETRRQLARALQEGCIHSIPSKHGDAPLCVNACVYFHVSWHALSCCGGKGNLATMAFPKTLWWCVNTARPDWGQMWIMTLHMEQPLCFLPPLPLHLPIPLFIKTPTS